MKNETPKWWRWFPWVLGIVVVGVGKFAWWQGQNDQIFALFGIVAWSVMWTHYVNGEMRRLNPNLPKNMLYHKVSSYVVLASLFLHPVLLAMALNPSGTKTLVTFYDYVPATSAWAIAFGQIALGSFLTFEILERLKSKAWVKKIWWIVNLSQSIAMTMIFFHALHLGSLLQTGWYRGFWILLGIILLPCMLHTHYSDLKGFKK